LYYKSADIGLLIPAVSCYLFLCCYSWIYAYG